MTPRRARGAVAPRARAAAPRLRRLAGGAARRRRGRRLVVAGALRRRAAPLPAPASPRRPASLADPVPYDGRSPLQVARDRAAGAGRSSRGPRSASSRTRGRWARRTQRTLHQVAQARADRRCARRSRRAASCCATSSPSTACGTGSRRRSRRSDIPRLNSPGSRVRTSGARIPAHERAGARCPARRRSSRPTSTAQPPVAVLDTGVDAEALDGHADPGYDAVDRDRDPKPGARPERHGRRETSGTALAGVVAAAGERVLPIRVASLRAAGGAVEAAGDHRRAASPGSSTPSTPTATATPPTTCRSRWSASTRPTRASRDSPEAQAVTGAAGLGTLVVAPAGNEGAAAPGSGTVGSPASAPRRAGGRRARRPRARAARPSSTLDGDTLADAAVLGGDAAARTAQTAGPVDRHRHRRSSATARRASAARS